MNFIKNIIAKIKAIFFIGYGTTALAVRAVARQGFKAAGFKQSVIALVFWIALAVVAWFGFTAAYTYMALGTAYGWTMYIVIHSVTHGLGFLLAMHMLGIFSVRKSYC